MREKLIELMAVSSLELEEAATLADHILASDLINELQNEAYDLGVESALKNKHGLSWQEAKEMREKARTDGKWIPVTERLPENAKKVLALVKRLVGDGYYTMLLRYNHKKGAFFDYDSEWGDRRIHDVTHWMPVPELPKGE